MWQTFETSIMSFFLAALQAHHITSVGAEKKNGPDLKESQKSLENTMQRNRLFKPYINFLNKKLKHETSYDFYVQSVYGFLRFRCFWNFFNFKHYFRSFNPSLEVKKNLTDNFFFRFKAFY